MTNQLWFTYQYCVFCGLEGVERAQSTRSRKAQFEWRRQVTMFVSTHNLNHWFCVVMFLKAEYWNRARVTNELQTTCVASTAPCLQGLLRTPLWSGSSYSSVSHWFNYINYLHICFTPQINRWFNWSFLVQLHRMLHKRVTTENHSNSASKLGT